MPITAIFGYCHKKTYNNKKVVRFEHVDGLIDFYINDIKSEHPKKIGILIYPSVRGRLDMCFESDYTMSKKSNQLIKRYSF